MFDKLENGLKEKMSPKGLKCERILFLISLFLAVRWELRFGNFKRNTIPHRPTRYEYADKKIREQENGKGRGDAKRGWSNDWKEVAKPISDLYYYSKLKIMI